LPLLQRKQNIKYKNQPICHVFNAYSCSILLRKIAFLKIIGSLPQLYLVQESWLTNAKYMFGKAYIGGEAIEQLVCFQESFL
jgi:hypothetical protein